MDELLGVLWAYKTTSQKPTGVSPFALTYGMEAIIPIKIGMPSLWTEIPRKTNTEAITKYLDMENELREAVATRIASYQQRMTNLYNRHIRMHTFRARDLVLRRVFENTVDLIAVKFQPNWEGSYMIVKVGASNSYSLNKLYRTPVPRMWNDTHLKRYY